MFLPRSIVCLAATWICAAVACGQMVEEEESEALEMATERAADEQQVNPSEVGELIVKTTNAFRECQSLSPVEANSNLRAAAEYFANYMAGNDVYGHTADGKRPAQRAKNHGYDYCLVAENIAYQFSSLGFSGEQLAERMVEGWKESPGHRENMLNPHVVDIGVAVAQSDKTGYWYAVQMFGRPKSASIEFTITNRSGTTIEYTIGDRTFTLPPRYSRTHLRCKQTRVELQLPEGKETIEPESGNRYVVDKKSGQWDVIQQ